MRIHVESAGDRTQRRRSWLTPIGFAISLSLAASLSTGGPTPAIALHFPAFWLIGWGASQLMPAQWSAAFGIAAIPLGLALAALQQW